MRCLRNEPKSNYSNVGTVKVQLHKVYSMASRDTSYTDWLLWSLSGFFSPSYWLYKLTL